ncbi:MAG: 3-dehydroquinate synthase [Peptostreptococcus sp.]|uniref:3-dehydroquinate synthase n=1 Tax=Peptostreptococcus sp. TaxID=1262 RepID=UPI002FCA1BF2
MRLNVKSKFSDYNIIIENGILASAGKLIVEMLDNKHLSVRKMFIVTDSNVDKIYGDTLKSNLEDVGFDVFKYVINPGEDTKNILTLAGIYSEMVEVGITRSDMIVTLGGGVVGDLAGFAAATYLRGIEYIQIPTTLLAQVDSSVGGKTAIDLPQGKNLVGSFYSPSLVIIDSEVLKTLDNRNLTNGMAEVIKYALIKDRSLFEMLTEITSREQLLDSLDEIIYMCCSIKKEIVQKDEFDRGDRMLLNFGHTLGHAIEAHYKFKKYLHGEAVAIGMSRITECAYKNKMVDEKILIEVRSIMKHYGLPISDEVKNKELLGYISKDKKNFGEDLNLIIVDKIGHGKIIKAKTDFFVE